MAFEAARGNFVDPCHPIPATRRPEDIRGRVCQCCVSSGPVARAVATRLRRPRLSKPTSFRASPLLTEQWHTPTVPPPPLATARGTTQKLECPPHSSWETALGPGARPFGWAWNPPSAPAAVRGTIQKTRMSPFSTCAGCGCHAHAAPSL